MTQTFDLPRTGPCAPWIAASDVLDAVAVENLATPPTEAMAAQMATVASEVLYIASARQFTGNCGPVTVRPDSRPTDIDTRFGHRGVPQGYQSAGQAASAYGVPGAIVNTYGTSKPPEVDLGAYPVTSILSVKIDGLLIPSDEYYLQSRRNLIRARPTAGATATARYGWPVNQLKDLPDTQPGTFSITYMYGSPPPSAGVLAAQVLAAQLTLNAMDEPNTLPQRLAHISRQGVTVDVPDVMDFLSKGLLGLYEVDLFVELVNPTKSRHRPLVWSPDISDTRRMPAG
jgi:hypothetical protein